MQPLPQGITYLSVRRCVRQSMAAFVNPSLHSSVVSLSLVGGCIRQSAAVFVNLWLPHLPSAKLKWS